MEKDSLLGMIDSSIIKNPILRDVLQEAKRLVVSSGTLVFEDNFGMQSGIKVSSLHPIYRKRIKRVREGKSKLIGIIESESCLLKVAEQDLEVFNCSVITDYGHINIWHSQSGNIFACTFETN